MALGFYPHTIPRRESAFQTSFSSTRASESPPPASLPSSKHISGLPNEILISVFNEGCELDERFWFNSIDYRRMRYPLISVARRVCTRWKHIVDGDSRFNREHFWFTFLRLSSFKSFNHQVVQFNRALSNSRGCDLHIEFCSPWYEEAEKLSTADAALLNLFTRVITFLVPYQTQITSFRIDVSQPQFLGHLLQLFATKLNSMTRRPSVVFPRQLPLLSDITSKPPIIPPSICADNFRARSPSRLRPRVNAVSFVRQDLYWGHPYLDLSWMDCGQIAFPFSITHLKIPELSLHKNYGFFDTVRNELVSLTISSSNEHQAPDITWDSSLQPPLKTIDFPKLRRLCISDPSSGSGWTDHFFKNVSCPRLEAVRITGISNPPLSSLADTFNPTSQNSVFPHLQELIVEEVDVSEYSLSCLARLASFSVRKLRIGFLSFYGCDGSGRQRITDVLKEVFRHMRPLEAYLDQLYQHLVFLPEVLNFSVVRELAIGNICEGITASPFPLSTKIKAPFLLKLDINTRYVSPFALLQHFECVSLNTLNLGITNGITNDLTTSKFEDDDKAQIERAFGELESIVVTARGKSKLPSLRNFRLIIRTRSIGDCELMQIFDKLSASRHLNGATLLALRQINSSEIWNDSELGMGRGFLKRSRPRLMCWEHVVILEVTPVGSIQRQPKQSRRMVLTDKHFNFIDQINFIDAYRIARCDTNHWVTQALTREKTEGIRACTSSTDPDFQ